MPLEFPIKFRSWELAHKAIAFPAIATRAGKAAEVTCRVAAKALIQRCGALDARPEHLYPAFDHHRALIEAAAARKFDAGALEADGGVLLGAADLR